MFRGMDLGENPASHSRASLKSASVASRLAFRLDANVRTNADCARAPANNMRTGEAMIILFLLLEREHRADVQGTPCPN